MCGKPEVPTGPERGREATVRHMLKRSGSSIARWSRRRPWAALLLALTVLIGIVGPASAQFFFWNNDSPQQRRPPRPPQGGGGWFGDSDRFFTPFQQPQPSAPKRREDYSRAPAPEKRETTPSRSILVMGDGMADWLAYGLEDAYADVPDVGIIRKNRPYSGLLRYQPKGEPTDWAAAAKSILQTERPDVIVMMAGLQDRMSIRNPGKPAPERGKAAATAKPGTANTPADDDPELSDQQSVAAPERGDGSQVEFRDTGWDELYTRKIDEMIAVLKSAGVPVIWVGLPAVRGAKSTSDMQYLDALYRDSAGKAGIAYVDVWDGFVDESGRYMQQGPDSEGQIRRLRSYDGVYFTKPGARKLAHYVEREISRLMGSQVGPILIPAEPAAPDVSAEPGRPPPRPLVGPVVPLVATALQPDHLLGGPAKPLAEDPEVSRVLVKGEPMTAPPGRADDFTWPRRPIGEEPARGEPLIVIAPKANEPAQTKATATAAAASKHRKRAVTADATRGGQDPRQQLRMRELPRPPMDMGRGAWIQRLFTW